MTASGHFLASFRQLQTPSSNFIQRAKPLSMYVCYSSLAGPSHSPSFCLVFSLSLFFILLKSRENVKRGTAIQMRKRINEFSNRKSWQILFRSLCGLCAKSNISQEVKMFSKEFVKKKCPFNQSFLLLKRTNLPFFLIQLH